MTSTFAVRGRQAAGCASPTINAINIYRRRRRMATAMRCRFEADVTSPVIGRPAAAAEYFVRGQGLREDCSARPALQPAHFASPRLTLGEPHCRALGVALANGHVQLYVQSRLPLPFPPDVRAVHTVERLSIGQRGHVLKVPILQVEFAWAHFAAWSAPSRSRACILDNPCRSSPRSSHDRARPAGGQFAGPRASPASIGSSTGGVAGDGRMWCPLLLLSLTPLALCELLPSSYLSLARFPRSLPSLPPSASFLPPFLSYDSPLHISSLARRSPFSSFSRFCSSSSRNFDALAARGRSRARPGPSLARKSDNEFASAASAWVAAMQAISRSRRFPQPAPTRPAALPSWRMTPTRCNGDWPSSNAWAWAAYLSPSGAWENWNSRRRPRAQREPPTCGRQVSWSRRPRRRSVSTIARHSSAIVRDLWRLRPGPTATTKLGHVVRAAIVGPREVWDLLEPMPLKADRLSRSTQGLARQPFFVLEVARTRPPPADVERRHRLLSSAGRRQRRAPGR